jgi:integrase
MSGTIFTRQKCPACGGKFPTSKGDFPIICVTCKTQPTKYLINIYHKGKVHTIYRDRNGQPLRAWVNATQLMSHIRSEIGTRKFFDPEIYKKQSSTSFKVFWDNFLGDYDGEEQLSTRDKLKTIGQHHLDFFADMQMRDIVGHDVKEWWKGLKKKKLSGRYMNDIHQWALKFFKEAYSLDIIEKVPHFPKTIKTAKKPPIEFLTQEEQERVFDELPAHDRPIFRFMFMTGARVGEAIGLQRSDIDFKKGHTVIQHTVKRDRKTIGEVKNKKPRIIPHMEEMEACLKEAVKVTGIGGLVFLNKWGRIYTADYLRDTFNRACKSANVTQLQLKNATRHSFGMRMIGSGVDIWTTSKAMGHSDIKMTENYAEILAIRLREAYETSWPFLGSQENKVI